MGSVTQFRTTDETLQGKAGMGGGSKSREPARARQQPGQRSSRPRLRELLVIEPNAERSASLIESLRRCGFRPSAAQGLLHALTILEWQRPDLILLCSGDDDMSPREFCHTVKSDPLFNKVPIAWITDQPAGHGSEEPFDIVLDYGDQEGLTKQVCTLLWRGLDSPRVGAETTSEAAAASASGLDRLLKALAELERAVRTGRLLIEPERGDDSAFLLLDNGQVVHAVCDRLLGPAALDRILADVGRAPELKCRFAEVSRWQMTAYPRSIRRAERQKSIRSAIDASSDSRRTGTSDAP